MERKPKKDVATVNEEPVSSPTPPDEPVDHAGPEGTREVGAEFSPGEGVNEEQQKRSGLS